MDVVFYNRDFTQRLDTGLEIGVERYSWHMIGGPDEAYLTARSSEDSSALRKLLRCPVEIRGDDGGLKWWGFVNRVSLPYGEQRVGLALDEMYNSVIARYGDVETTDTTYDQGILEYGTKATKITVSNADQTQGEAARDLYLANHKYERTEFEYSGGKDTVSIQCYGWYTTLDWQYYSALSTSANVENTTIITSIVSSVGQFFTGSIIEDIANQTSDPYRDGTMTGGRYINQILNAGTSNVRPLLATVDKDRYLHVYERSAEPIPGVPDYLYGKDGRLYNPLNQLVPDQDCKCAVWAQLQDEPNTLGGFSTIRPFFIESSEYNVEQDKTTYQPANAYEQIRLAKYVSDITDYNSGGGFGSASTAFPGWFPTVPPVQDIKTRLHRYSTAPSTEILTATGAFLTIDGVPAATVNFTYNGLGIFTPGTDGIGNPGWLIANSGIYDIEFYATLNNGSSAPTTGSVEIRLLQYPTGAGRRNEIAVPAGGGINADLTRKFSLILVKDSYLEVSITNNTDGGVLIGNFDLIVTKERFTGST